MLRHIDEGIQMVYFFDQKASPIFLPRTDSRNIATAQRKFNLKPAYTDNNL